MGRIAKPRRELIFLWRKAGIKETYPRSITRAYYREFGKFVPIGWYLRDTMGESLLVTDEQVDNVPFAEAMRSN